MPLGLLVLQLLLGLFAPVADAQGEAQAADAVVHVESDDRPACPTGHNHLQCQFCRHLGTNLLRTPGVERTPQPGAALSARPSANIIAPASVQRIYPLGSRAPPLA